MLTALCSGLALMMLLFAPLLFVREPSSATPHSSPSAPAVLEEGAPIRRAA